MPALFSELMEYENPEQPPPTTPMRRPAGTGFCCAMISRTLLSAVGVRLSGDAFGVAGVLAALVTGVVDMVRVSSKINNNCACVDYSKAFRCTKLDALR